MSKASGSSAVVAGVSATISATITAIAIYWVYGAELFQRWNWFRVSLILTLISSLLPSFAIVNRITSDNPEFFVDDETGGKIAAPWKMKWNELHGVVMAVLFFFGFPFLFLVVYPGPENLGLHSDRTFPALLISWIAIHLANYAIQSRCQMRQAVTMQYAALCLAIPIVVIVLSGWLGPLYMAGGWSPYMDE